MRVVVTGASGNVGTAVLRALRRSREVDSIVGIARRPPLPPTGNAPAGGATDGVEWVAADVTTTELAPLFAGADAVVHLAWLIQPSHDQQLVQRVNVEGSRRVFDAAAAAGVTTLIHASSVGVYSPRSSDEAIGEDYPRDGIASSYYSRDKAMVEAVLDAWELRHPQVRVVRLRPGLIFQASAGSEIVRYFFGRFVPARLLRPDALPVLPIPRGLSLQAVHSDDVAEAYLQALVRPEARGAYNVAAEPLLDATAIAGAFGARAVPVPAGLTRGLAALTWHLHLQPVDGGWLDMGLLSPTMDVSRARAELGWAPRHTADQALREVVAGMRGHAGGGTPVLDPLPPMPERLAGKDRETADR